jgi:uncharacterized RDD family membrane protein YckC
VDEQRSPIAPERREPDADGQPSAISRAVGAAARVGWIGARGISRRLGIDRAVGSAVERGVDQAMDSDTAARATQRLLETETARRVWQKVLESEQAQGLVERVAEAPEVRSAITAQGVGLLEDIRSGLRDVARRLDTATERAARGVLRREQRPARPIYAGAVTRLLALAIDAGVVYGSLLLISAAVALLVSAISSADHAGSVVIALGASVWALIALGYLAFFWSGAGRTPGMSFVGLRMLSDDGGTVPVGHAIRRALWIPISAFPFLLGFLGILLEPQRRGWPDRRAHTVVCYADPKLDKDLVPGAGN